MGGGDALDLYSTRVSCNGGIMVSPYHGRYLDSDAFSTSLGQPRVPEPNKRYCEEGGIHAKGTVRVQADMGLGFVLPGSMIY